MRASTAYQQVDKVFNERHKKLNEDAQKEQVACATCSRRWRMTAAKLTPEQIRQQERELQDRITNSQRKFGERNRIIQEAGQYVMAQINRSLAHVVQQVAQSRGINVVLNRAQVLGNMADFDLTDQVAEELNKVLPSVVIPPDGVSPLTMVQPESEPVPPTSRRPQPAAPPPAMRQPAGRACGPAADRTPRAKPIEPEGR